MTGPTVLRNLRARYRLLRWWSHAWLSRHPRLRDSLQAAGSLKGGPEMIARGVAIGLFIGLTPTVGVQTVLMIAVCLLLSANFPIAFATSFIANPFTIAPLYWGYHELGEAVVESLPGFDSVPEAGMLGGVGDEIMFTGIGSLLIATPVAIGAYLLTHLLLVAYSHRRQRPRRSGHLD